MNIQVDYQSFCDAYYKAAEQVADITIAEYIKKHGELNRGIDIELVKDLGVSYGLEKVFSKYDIDHESNASIKTFLSTVVRNSVLTELGKETTATGAKDRSEKDLDNFYGFCDEFKTRGLYKRKEDLIDKMLECLKKIDGEDQVILRCWMQYQKRDYTDMALAELGREDNARTRNVITVRRDRAIEKLRGMMEKERDNYNDIVFDTISAANRILDSFIVQKPQSDMDNNFARRRKRAANKSITAKINYSELAQALMGELQDWDF